MLLNIKTTGQRAAGLIVAASIAIMSITPQPANAQGTAKALDEQAVRDIVIKTINEHPEIILQALRTLEQRAQAAKAEQTLSANKVDIFRHKDDPVGGNPKGDVTLVEFFDYQCGFCKQVHPAIQQLLKEDTKLRYVYKELPILGPASVFATRAALAAKSMGQYRKLSEALMASRGALSEKRIFSIAAASGLDINRLKQRIQSGEEEAKTFIGRNYKLAEELNINGTPAFIIGDQVIPGAASLETLRTAIAKAREAKLDN